MRILHVNDHLAPKGGVETYLLSSIPHLEQDGIEQGVAFGSGDPNLVKHAFELPLLSKPGWGSSRAITSQLRSTLQNFRPDVIHLHSIYNADAIEFLLDHCPVVMTSHDYRYLCPASNFYWRKTQTVCNQTCSPACYTTTLTKKCMTLRPQYSWKYYQRVQRVRKRFADFRQLIAPSQGAADRFIQNDFPPDNITVLPYFCRISPLSQPRPVPEKHNMLFLGRLSDNKGWRYFVEALGQLPADVSGTIVGNMTPQVEQTLRQLADQHGCADRLQWATWADQQQISQRFMETSVLVFPSLWPETLGIVGLEAMAHGVPVVASDIGGVREWLHDSQNGYLVPPGDAGAISAAIQRIVSDRPLATAMGQYGLRYLCERFLPEQHLSQLKLIYSNAA